MSYPYSNSVDDPNAAATFPVSVFDPFDVRDKDQDSYAVVGETGTVPASADGDGRYRVFLDMVPLEQSSFTLTVGGSARDRVPYGEAPAAGQVAVSMVTGAVEFHASDAGASWSASYTGSGTAVTAAVLNRVQNELVAVQEEVDGLDTVYQPLDAGLTDIAGLTPTDGNVIVGNGTTWVAESGATARTSLGLGAADSPTLLGLTLGETATGTENVPVLRLTAQARYLPQIKLYEGNSGNSATFELDGDSQQLEIWVTGGVENRLIYDDHGHMVLNNVTTIEGLSTNGDIGCLGDLAVGGDLTLEGEVLADLEMGAGTDMHLSNTGKFYFSPTGYFGRGSSDAQLGLRGSLSASGSILGSSLMWVYHGDSGADALTWLGAENSSSTGSAETNIFGRFRNASNSPVAQFLAFRGTDRTAGSEDGEIVARPLVNGALRDVAKFSSIVSLLPKEKVLIAPDSAYTGAALEIDVANDYAPFLHFNGNNSAATSEYNISSAQGTGAVVGPQGDGGADAYSWNFHRMVEAKLTIGASTQEVWIPVYTMNEP